MRTKGRIWNRVQKERNIYLDFFFSSVTHTHTLFLFCQQTTMANQNRFAFAGPLEREPALVLYNQRNAAELREMVYFTIKKKKIKIKKKLLEQAAPESFGPDLPVQLFKALEQKLTGGRELGEFIAEQYPGDSREKRAALEKKAEAVLWSRSGVLASVHQNLDAVEAGSLPWIQAGTADGGALAFAIWGKHCVYKPVTLEEVRAELEQTPSDQ